MKSEPALYASHHNSLWVPEDHEGAHGGDHHPCEGGVCDCPQLVPGNAVGPLQVHLVGDRHGKFKN